jgi:dsRNA-specific ribonuclease
MTKVMYAILGAIEAEYGFETARKWLTERYLSVVDVEDPSLAVHWRSVLTELRRNQGQKPLAFYNAGINIRYHLSNSPFTIQTEIIYIMDGRKVRN